MAHLKHEMEHFPLKPTTKISIQIDLTTIRIFLNADCEPLQNKQYNKLKTG